MNSSSGAVACEHGEQKTVPKRRFRRRMGVRRPVSGAHPRRRPTARARPARGLQRAQLDRAHRLSVALHAPRPAAVGGAVYQQTRRWLKAGVFEAMVHDLRVLLRLSEGRPPAPTAAILDSRTLQSTPESGHRGGWDGHKRRKGSKVHAAVDTLGHLLASFVGPASEQERARVGELAEAVQEATGESVELAYVDHRATPESTRPKRRRPMASQVGGGQARRGQAGFRLVAEEVGRGTRFRMGITIQAPGQGLREAARYFGGVALRGVRLPIPASGNRRSRRGSITGSSQRAQAHHRS